MTKDKIAVLLFTICLFLSSCAINNGPVSSYNGPAFYHNDISYQPKPISADTVHHAIYVSGTLINGRGANSNDEINAGQANLGMAFTIPHFNFSYGVFGTAGSFSNSTVPYTQPYYFDNKFTGMTGGRGSVDYYITSGHVDVRIIGLEMSYSHEFGDYADYRREVSGQANFFTNTNTNLFTWGGTSEVTWYSRNPGYQFGFRLFLGETNTLNNFHNGGFFDTYNTDRTYGSLAYFMQFYRYFMVAEVNNSGGHISLGYAFK